MELMTSAEIREKAESLISVAKQQLQLERLILSAWDNRSNRSGWDIQHDRVMSLERVVAQLAKDILNQTTEKSNA